MRWWLLENQCKKRIIQKLCLVEKIKQTKPQEFNYLELPASQRLVESGAKKRKIILSELPTAPSLQEDAKPHCVAIVLP